MNPRELNEHIRGLQRASDDVSEGWTDMLDAYDLERDARRKLLGAICDAVAYAIPAIADGTRTVLVSAGNRVDLPVLQLDVTKAHGYYLAWNSGDWHLCVGGAQVLSLLPTHQPLPRGLRIHEAVERIGERLRSSMDGNGTERLAGARRMADKMAAIEVLLRTD